MVRLVSFPRQRMLMPTAPAPASVVWIRRKVGVILYVDSADVRLVGCCSDDRHFAVSTLVIDSLISSSWQCGVLGKNILALQCETHDI